MNALSCPLFYRSQVQVYVKSMYCCYLSKEIFVRGEIHLCLVKGKKSLCKAFLCIGMCQTQVISFNPRDNARRQISIFLCICEDIEAHLLVPVTCPKSQGWEVAEWSVRPDLPLASPRLEALPADGHSFATTGLCL